VLREGIREIPTDTAGVYCLYDLDGEAAYVGQSGDIRSRLRQHFIRQDSSVVSYGRLDIWDIYRIEWWESDHRDSAEQALLRERDPYLNFESEVNTSSSGSPINLDEPDGHFQIIDSEERQYRADPYNRSRQKLEHMTRMIDKIRFAGHSDQTRRTFYEHRRILNENVEEFLGVGDPS
jgi:hypothetical protein